MYTICFLEKAAAYDCSISRTGSIDGTKHFDAGVKMEYGGADPAMPISKIRKLGTGAENGWHAVFLRENLSPSVILLALSRGGQGSNPYYQAGGSTALTSITGCWLRIKMNAIYSTNAMKKHFFPLFIPEIIQLVKKQKTLIFQVFSNGAEMGLRTHDLSITNALLTD